RTLFVLLSTGAHIRSVRWPGCCRPFFFHAEDGIRDRNVTGVQTCALPILMTIFARLTSSFIFSAAFLLNLASPVFNASTRMRISGFYCVESLTPNRVYIMYDTLFIVN